MSPQAHMVLSAFSGSLLSILTSISSSILIRRKNPVSIMSLSHEALAPLTPPASGLLPRRLTADFRCSPHASLHGGRNAEVKAEAGEERHCRIQALEIPGRDRKESCRSMGAEEER